MSTYTEARGQSSRPAITSRAEVVVEGAVHEVLESLNVAAALQRVATNLGHAILRGDIPRAFVVRRLEVAGVRAGLDLFNAQRLIGTGFVHAKNGCSGYPSCRWAAPDEVEATAMAQRIFELEHQLRGNAR